MTIDIIYTLFWNSCIHLLLPCMHFFFDNSSRVIFLSFLITHSECQFYLPFLVLFCLWTQMCLSYSMLIFGILHVHKASLKEPLFFFFLDYVSPYSNTNSFCFCLYFFFLYLDSCKGTVLVYLLTVLVQFFKFAPTDCIKVVPMVTLQLLHCILSWSVLHCQQVFLIMTSCPLSFLGSILFCLTVLLVK